VDGSVGTIATFVGILILVTLAVCLLGFALALVVAGIKGALHLFRLVINGALEILTFASEQGFVGLAAYAACWVFMLPLMLVASVVVGVCVANTKQTAPLLPEEQAQAARHAQAALAAQLEADDRRYEEKKAKTNRKGAVARQMRK
jgi:hypothetical protein